MSEEAQKVKIELYPREAALLMKHLQHNVTVLGQGEAVEYIVFRELFDLIEKVEKQLTGQGVAT